jgi:hypothetical protein
MDGKQVKEVLATMGDKQAEEVLAMIASAIQTANLDYPEMADGGYWDQQVKSNEESRHLTRAVLERLWANGYEIRPKSNA